jgi:glucose-6-phosphate 1-dehydrogenase
VIEVTEVGDVQMVKQLVIFGASGDLARRFLLPALAQLACQHRLPPDFRVLGVARKPWTEREFRDRVVGALREHAGSLPASARERFFEQVKLEYANADATRPHEMARILPDRGESLVAYLALPPAVFPAMVTALGERGLAPDSRIVIEKPFGEDLESARKLNRLLRRWFDEDAIFRMDHFLGIQTAQNILGLRFGNRLFEPIWSRQHIRRVELTWEETLALEGRAAYYDGTGALRDMVQNHLLQLLCLVAMEPPLSLSERDLRGRKVDVLRAVAPLGPKEVRERTVRARYGRGRIGSREVPGYVEEQGVDGSRGTETFAQVTLEIDNWRWAGVPFVLRTGKALAETRTEVRIELEPVPHVAFGSAEGAAPNQLRLSFDPECLALRMNVTGSSDPERLRELELRADLHPGDLPAYARLIEEVLQGNPSFFIRADEAEESWRIIQPVLDGWAHGLSPLREYAAGSRGP